MILSAGPDWDECIDALEAWMHEFPPLECRLIHTRTPGLYVRTILMPVGSLITSMTHSSQHPFHILAGTAYVWCAGRWERLSAPTQGITMPGTRRVLYIEQDCIWATMHACDDEETVEEIEDRILVKRTNKFLGGTIKNNILTKTLEPCLL